MVGGDDAEPMELATEPELGAVTQAAASGEDGSLARESIQVTAEPRLPFDEERTNLVLGPRPASAPGDRDGHDDSALGMDDHAKTAGPRRPSERVVERAARQVKRSGGFGDGHIGMVPCRWRWP